MIILMKYTYMMEPEKIEKELDVIKEKFEEEKKKDKFIIKEDLANGETLQIITWKNNGRLERLYRLIRFSDTFNV